MPRNVDFQKGKSVPFTQYLRSQWICKGSDGIDDEVIEKARKIVNDGFFLEMEEVNTLPREVLLSIGDDDGDYAMFRCVNGPEVPRTVRKMILETDLSYLQSARKNAKY